MDVEQVQRGRILDVGRIDEHQAVGERTRDVGGKEVKADQLVDEVPLAVDHDDGTAVLQRRDQVRVDHALHELGFPVPRPAHDVAMLEAHRVGHVEWDGEGEERLKGRAGKVEVHELRRVLVLLSRGEDELFRDLVRVCGRRETGGDKEVQREPLADALEELEPHSVVVVECHDEALDRLCWLIEERREGHRERRLLVAVPRVKAALGQGVRKLREGADELPAHDAHHAVVVERPTLPARDHLPDLDGHPGVGLDQRPVELQRLDVLKLKQAVGQERDLD